MPDTDKTDALAIAKKAAKAARPRCNSGLYSWVNSKRWPQDRSFQKNRRELAQLRERLINERGGPDKLTAGELVMIDSVIEGLGVQKILGLYVRKYGVLDAQAAKRGSLELSPVLSRNWISYANQVRQGLLALEELRKARGREEDGPSILAEYIRQADAAAAEKVAQAADEPAETPTDAENRVQTRQDGQSEPETENQAPVGEEAK